MDDVTWDDLFGGVLRIKQKKTGYRYSIDPVLLSHFITPGPSDHILDLGSGSGIIPAILSHRHPGITLTGIEIQESLAKVASENIRFNRLENRVRILLSDMRYLTDSDLPLVDVIVANPPYTPVRSGRINPDPEKAMARHEITITLAELVRTASTLLRSGGRLALIYPPSRFSELENQLSLNGLDLIRIRYVHPFAGRPPVRVLVEAKKNTNTGVTIDNPLVIFKSAGIYSDEVHHMFL